MARKLFKSRRDDPRYLLQKSVRLMAKTLDQLAKRAEEKEERSATGALMRPGGLGEKDIGSLIGLASSLHRLARQADQDDVARYRQLKGMTDEQLAEQEKRLASAQHSEAIKEGLRNKKLADEVQLEDDDGDPEADS